MAGEHALQDRCMSCGGPYHGTAACGVAAGGCNVNPFGQRHPLHEAIGGTDSDQERAFCVALLNEGPDVIERVLRRYLDLRDGRVEMPEWARR